MAWWRKSSPEPQAPVISTPGIRQDYVPKAWAQHRFGLPEARWRSLAGKAYWVIGAGTGYGRSIAIALAAAGAHVYISGRRAEKLQETIEEAAALGIEAERFLIPVPMDATNDAGITATVRAIENGGLGVHGLVNCAAVPQRETPYPLLDQPPEEWSQMMAVNVTAQWRCVQALTPLLAASRSLRAIFMTSEAGWASTQGFGPYNVSKSALNTLGASYAVECAKRFPALDVQMNVLVPGEAHTEMNQGSKVSPYAVVPMVLVLLSHPVGGPNGCFFHRDGRHLSFAYTSPFSTSLL